MNFIFGRRRMESATSVSSSRNADGKEVYMDDLVLHPNGIDAKLEGKITEWQNAINDYQAFEDICKEEIGNELMPILEHLRAKPKLFNGRKYSVNVVTLANKLIKVNELQSKLETSSRDDDSSSCGSRMRYYLCYCVSSHEHTENESMLRDTVQISTNASMSDKLSAKWALRLNEINPTQGTLAAFNPSKAGENNGLNKKEPLEVKIKPKWPDFLIDTYFDVIKINMYGRKMRRIIKLNQHYVVNITNGCEISKFYAYKDIRRVWLESGNTIVVMLKNGKQSVYMSHIAPHVLQQVGSKLSSYLSIIMLIIFSPPPH